MENWIQGIDLEVCSLKKKKSKADKLLIWEKKMGGHTNTWDRNENHKYRENKTACSGLYI